MNILYDPDSHLGLHNFGIEIPLTDQRTNNVMEFLQRQEIPLNKVRSRPDYRLMTKEDIALAHSHDFTNRLFGTEDEKAAEIIKAFELKNPDGSYHRYNPANASLPLSKLVEQALLQTSGTLAAGKVALEQGESFFLGGGFHHAMTFEGRGFCVLNDIVIAARYLQRNHAVKNIWVIDIDVHKGDGTAQITQNDPSISTFSIHMADGWPLDDGGSTEAQDEKPWWIPSTIDVPVAQGESQLYLQKLKDGLTKLADLDRPDLAFVIQGSDPYVLDSLPSSQSIQLNLEQMIERDFLVYNLLKELQVPHCHLMAGGYGPHSHEPFNSFFGRLKELNTFSRRHS